MIKGQGRGLISSPTRFASAGLYKEFQHKLDKYRQDLSDYFPAHHFGSSKVQAKPRNSGWGQREMTVVDDVGNRIVFFQELNTK